MARNTSVLLGDHFEHFIQERVASGRFTSTSEVIRTALRLMEREEEQIKMLRSELEAGEKSGTVTDFDPKAHLQGLRSKNL